MFPSSQSSSAPPLPHECTRLSRARSTISRSDFALQRLPFSGVSHIVRHTRSALTTDQDRSGSPRSLDASFFERAVHSDPAAVSGHLAIYGVPTGACQPLRCCRPADKYLTRLICFTFVTARASLCLRLCWRRPKSEPLIRVAIAVGMPVARHPPHRSVRARFRHTAPTLGV